MPGKEKMKIVFLNHWAANTGGAEHSLMDILNASVKKFKCSLITTERGLLTEFAENIGVEIFVAEVNKNIANFKRDDKNPIKLLSGFYFIPYLLKVKKILTEIDPDLIHANIPKSHILLLLLKNAGIKTKSIIHMREIFDNILIKKIYSFLFTRNCKVISISKAVEKSLPSKLQNVSQVIYNGITIPNKIPKHKEIQDTINLSYLGRIVPWKGCHLLIDIFKSVVESDPKNKYKLNLFGDTLYWNPSYRKDIESKIIKFGLEESCKLHNSTTDITKVFSETDIFLNASYNEPFGRVLAEASAHYLPVITFSTGGANEVIDSDTGILIDNQDLKIFSEAIIKLANDSNLRTQLGSAGRKKAENLFNKDKQLDLLLDLFQTFLTK